MDNAVLSRIIGFVVIVCAIGVAGYLWYRCGYNACVFIQQKNTATIDSYEACVRAGGVLLETYPSQCKSGGATFIQPILPFGNNEIHITSPMLNSSIQSPVTVRGEARGSWYFEGQFPVRIVDGNGRGVAFAIAHAQGDWMTNEFVPFEVKLAFFPHTPNGAILFEKDNPSGLPESASAVAMPVLFSSYIAITPTPMPVASQRPTPTPVATLQGALLGTVTIGPLCPKEPCRSSVKAFASHVISVRKPDTVTPVATIIPGPTGQFSVSLPVGDYVVTMPPQARGSVKGVPANIQIKADSTTTLNIDVDTGIGESEDVDTPAGPDGF